MREKIYIDWEVLKTCAADPTENPLLNVMEIGCIQVFLIRNCYTPVKIGVEEITEIHTIHPEAHNESFGTNLFLHALTRKLGTVLSLIITDHWKSLCVSYCSTDCM